MITSYDVIEKMNLVELINVVNVRLSQGWQPFGGLKSDYIITENKTHYLQVLVKNTKAADGAVNKPVVAAPVPLGPPVLTKVASKPIDSLGEASFTAQAILDKGKIKAAEKAIEAPVKKAAEKAIQAPVKKAAVNTTPKVTLPSSGYIKKIVMDSGKKGISYSGTLEKFEALIDEGITQAPNPAAWVKKILTESAKKGVLTVDAKGIYRQA